MRNLSSASYSREAEIFRESNSESPSSHCAKLRSKLPAGAVWGEIGLVRFRLQGRRCRGDPAGTPLQGTPLQVPVQESN